MAITTLEKCQLIELPKISDPRGNLTFVEAGRHIPFDIQRVYYLYDVPGGAERGGHAHKGLHQLIVAMSGSFDIHLDDRDNQKTIHLNRRYVRWIIFLQVPYAWCWRQTTTMSRTITAITLIF